MNKFIRLMLSIPKTIVVNLRAFPLRTAMKMPLLVAYNAKCTLKRKSVFFVGEISSAMVQIGFSEGSFNLSDGKRTILDIHQGGKIVFGGSAKICKGSAITVGENSVLEIGKNFFCNANFLLSAAKKITIGNDFLSGWNCTIIDGDGHRIVDMSTGRTSAPREVTIGNHVWMAAEASILKGTNVPDDTVIGYGSVVSGRFTETNTVLADGKASAVKRGVSFHE